MPTLLVVANPQSDSLTRHVAERLEAVLIPGDVEIADLAAEGFDPRFTLGDRHVYHHGSDYPVDVLREQRRLARVSDLVLIFPVYWWSMPALLKGWIDRVFVNGWAFDYAPSTGIERKLQGLTIHLIPVAGDDASLYARHGYEQALRTQIEHGIVDYCGSRRGTTAFLYDSEQEDVVERQRSIDQVVTSVSQAILSSSAGEAAPRNVAAQGLADGTLGTLPH